MVKNYFKSVLLFFVFGFYFLPLFNGVLAFNPIDKFKKPKPTPEIRKVEKVVEQEKKEKYILPVNSKHVYISTHYEDFHYGIDLASNGLLETPDIVATAEGKVIYVRDTNYDMEDYGWGYGKTVVVEHAGGIYSLYAHLSTFEVEEGDKVKQGEKLGEMGSTGNSTGIHLHFEMCKDKCSYDAEKLDPIAIYNIANDENNLLSNGNPKLQRKVHKHT